MKASELFLQTNSNLVDIINQLNYILQLSPKLTNIIDFLVRISALNKNKYYVDILPNLSQYCITNYEIGIEYLLIIDGSHSDIYCYSETNNEIQKIPRSSNIQGLHLLSCVRNGEIYNIRRVIVDNGIYVGNIKTTDINKLNIKYSKLLQCNCMKYDILTDNTYKKYINDISNKFKLTKGVLEIAKIDNYNNVYTWSPAKSSIPITFYCRQCPNSHLNNYDIITDKTLYFLFLTVDHQSINYINDVMSVELRQELFNPLSNKPIEQNSTNSQTERSRVIPMCFSPSTMPTAYIFYTKTHNLDKTYIKLDYSYFSKKKIPDINKHQISYESINTHKYGDLYKDVELNKWSQFINPITLDNLIIDKKDISSQMYFVGKKQHLYEAPIKMNNYIKKELIGRIKQNNQPTKVIDLASGRGSDLWSYIESKINNLLCIEIDKDAIDELVERKYKVNNMNKTNINILNADLNSSYKSIITKINNNMMIKSSSKIYCFFALHYITDTIPHIRNIANLISKLLETGGKFIYTAFDEKAVLNLLQKNNNRWTVHENNIKKYDIMTSKQKIKGNRNAIDLILPFNNSDHYYTEYLINDKLIDAEFLKCKLSVSEEGCFSKFLNGFKIDKNHFYRKLTDADNIFNNLYKYKIYIKN